MKYILFVLFLYVCSFAQYSPDTLMTNGSFETFTGTADDNITDSWPGCETNAGDGFIDASASNVVNGSYSVHIKGSTVSANRVRRNYTDVGVGLFRVSITIKDHITRSGILLFQISNGTTDSTYYSTGFVYLDGAGGAGGGTKRWKINVQTSSTKPKLSMYIGVSQGNPPGYFYFDYNTYQHVLDTLWTNSDQADETDNDTTKTLSEAFETRGSHSGGTFITEPGTWDETISIDSSFALWRSATAGEAVTVTAVDFNGVTATLLDVYVTTPTNDGNITYTYTPAATDETKRKFGNYSGWGGW